jgi:hypothetical protein
MLDRTPLARMLGGAQLNSRRPAVAKTQALSRVDDQYTGHQATVPPRNHTIAESTFHFQEKILISKATFFISKSTFLLSKSTFVLSKSTDVHFECNADHFEINADDFESSADHFEITRATHFDSRDDFESSPRQ